MKVDLLLGKCVLFTISREINSLHMFAFTMKEIRSIDDQSKRISAEEMVIAEETTMGSPRLARAQPQTDMDVHC